MIDISFGDISKDEEYYTEQLDKYFFSEKTAEHIRSIKSRSNKSSRVSSLCALYVLARLLSENGIDTENLAIEKTGDGKPYFVNSDVYFSISHTDTKFAVAICDKPVGIDLEDKMLTDEKMQSIAKRYFAKGKFDIALDRSSFLKIWTFVEAYAKMKGLPLAKIIGKVTPAEPNVNKIYNEYNGAVICVCY